MHFSSSRSLRFFIKDHILEDEFLGKQIQLQVLDIGASDINGSARQAFEGIGAAYTGVDLIDGENVDIVMSSASELPFPDQSFDVVCSLQTFEHAPKFWELFGEMVRVCKPEGVMLVIAPSEGAEHRFPVDCYRFLPDSFKSLANDHDLCLTHVERDKCGPFHDLIGVFHFRAHAKRTRIDLDWLRWSPIGYGAQNQPPEIENPAVEIRKGEKSAYELLHRVHELLEPRHYAEIGVWNGASLRLAKCSSVGVDPFPVISDPLPPSHEIYPMSSEEFFRQRHVHTLLNELDFAYIDGMHSIEHVLLDFMQLERFASSTTVIAMDDIFPNHPVQARRQRASTHWTGDVWKIVGILKQQRPDLLLLPIDTSPTGTLLIFGLDSGNSKLWDVYDFVLHFQMVDRDPPSEVLNRQDAISPADRLLSVLLNEAKRNREGRLPIEQMKQLVRDALPREIGSVA